MEKNSTVIFQKDKITESETRTVKVSEVFLCEDYDEKQQEHCDSEWFKIYVERTKEYGVVPPLFVKECEGGYEVVIGQKRFHAAKLAGLDTVPIIVMNGVFSHKGKQRFEGDFEDLFDYYYDGSNSGKDAIHKMAVLNSDSYGIEETDALLIYGLLLLKDEERKKNPNFSAGLEIIITAAERGNNLAAFLLGALNETSLLYDGDYDLMCKYYLESAERGYIPSIKRIQEFSELVNQVTCMSPDVKKGIPANEAQEWRRIRMLVHEIVLIESRLCGNRIRDNSVDKYGKARKAFDVFLKRNAAVYIITMNNY